MSKARVSIAVGFVVSGAILFWLLSQLDWATFFRELSRVQLAYLPLFCLVLVLSQWIRALRWRLLLPSGLKVSTMDLFSACNLGTLATCVLPLRAGEFVRPWVLSRKKTVTFSRAFSSIVTERVFDVLAMLTLFVITLGGIENPPAWAPLCAKGLAVLATGILTVMLSAYFRPELVLRVMTRIFDVLFSKRAPQLCRKLEEMGSEFIQGLRAISSAKELLLVVIASYALWFSISLYFYFGLLSFGLDVGFDVANAVNVFVALAVAAPSAPGFLGTFQIGCVAALSQMYGYSEEFATAYSVVLHSLQMIVSVGLGFAMLQYEGMSFAQLRSRGDATLGEQPTPVATA